MKEDSEDASRSPLFSALAYPHSNLFLSQTKFILKTGIGLGGFDGIQVMTLEIFDERHFELYSIRVHFFTIAGTRSKPASFAARKRRSPAISWYSTSVPVSVSLETFETMSG